MRFYSLASEKFHFFSERYYHAAILNGHEIMVVGGYDNL